jgi:hypothetical protein
VQESNAYTWRSAEGIEVTLKGTRMEQLAECERAALQHIALKRLNKAGLGCTVVKPKGKHLTDRVTRRNNNVIDSLQLKTPTKKRSQKVQRYSRARASTLTLPESKGMSTSECAW